MCGGDRASDNHVIRARDNRSRRSGYTGLIIVNGARCRAHPRDKNQEFAAASPADGASFSRRGHDPIQAGLLRQTRELDRANLERAGKADLSHF